MSNQLSLFSFKKWLLSELLARAGGAPIRILLWDGTEGVLPGVAPLGTVVIKDPWILVKLFLNPELYFGQGYEAGRIEVEGNLVDMLTAVYDSMSRRAYPGWHHALISFWQDRAQANSNRGSRRNIHRHYDLGNDFYKLWLDRQLLYTCAYFPRPNDGLEEAQIAKMHYVCRKVRLQPGETVVEAGCGWGALALHMAKFYGAVVKAFNISHEQIIYAREWARREGLADRVEFIEDDYRNISGKFDVFMSVGMLEHVGPDHYKELGEVIHRSLPASGRGFLHFIGRNRPGHLNAWIRRRVFPGAHPPTLREVMRVFERHNFSVLDVENLRLHYARTLEHWLERFEKSSDRVRSLFGEEFVRIWRLYLAGSVAAFQAGTLQLFQIAFARATNNSLSWTRNHLYAEELATEPEQKWIPAMS